MFRIFLVCLVASLSCESLLAQLSKEQKLIDFQQLAALFSKRYAFLEWKKDAVNFNGLDLRPWIDRINKSPDDVDFFEICAQYVASYQDSHTAFQLPSDYQAQLGFTADLYDDKIVIDQVSRQTLPAGQFPFEVGDELISIDGKLVADLLPYYMQTVGDGSRRLNRRQAAVFLTIRPQFLLPRAHQIGESATIMVQRRSGGTETYVVPWQKFGTPYEMAGPVPTPTQGTAPAAAENRTPGYMRQIRAMQKFKLPTRRAALGFGELAPVFTLPASFQQHTGTNTSDNLYTGVYEASGLKIGYLRAADFESFYSFDLQAEIPYLDANSDGLIVDMTRNPGGYGCDAEMLASFLNPAAFRSIGISVRPTWEQVLSLEFALADAQAYGTDEEIATVQMWLNQYKEAYKNNRGFTPPLPICGLSQNIEPATTRQGRVIAYTKPIIVLIDDFSASAAELFAAIMQDNGRAVLFGTRTAGAGGTVEGTSVGFYMEGASSYASSIVVRKSNITIDGYPSAPYIENIGVQPDTQYDYQTVDNLVNKGKPFVDAVTSAMTSLIQAKKGL